MAGNSSEEKNLPPSAKKLREAREKGQVAKAPDLVTAIATIAALGYLMGGGDWIVGELRQGVTTAADAASLPFADAMRLTLVTLGGVLARVLGPLLALTLLGVIVGGVAVNGGFLLAMDPLMPKLETLDPIKGVGKLFKLKNLLEVAKSIIKATLFGLVAVRMALAAAPPLVGLPGCGVGCIGVTAAAVLRPMAGAACGLYLVAGVVDLLLQRWLFRREMKMSITEQRRERKDQDGDPFVRRAQRQRRREAATGVQLGLGQATLVIAGDDAAIGLRYVRGETDFPTVVIKGGNAEKAAPLVGQARAAKLPVFWDNALALAMSAKLKPGERIAQEFFQRVAQALYSTGVVRG